MIQDKFIALLQSGFVKSQRCCGVTDGIGEFYVQPVGFKGNRRGGRAGEGERVVRVKMNPHQFLIEGRLKIDSPVAEALDHLDGLSRIGISGVV